MNQWTIMRRPQANDVKGKWKEFIAWFVEVNGLTNIKISKCSMTFISYFKTKIRKDVDNTVPKFILDGLVEGGIIEDDDSNHLVSLTLRVGYDKFRPRTEIYIKEEVDI
jgi:Holliday junction resolvase RusA-like endonuclease